MKAASQDIRKGGTDHNNRTRVGKRPATVFRMVLTAFVLGYVATGYVDPCEATPFTAHFDNLISDLQSREASLSNSADRIQQNELKAIRVALGTLEGKNSTSLGTDIQSLGSVAKILAKAFPNDFASPNGTFSMDLETALQGLIGDVNAILDATQSTVNGLDASPCATKAQGRLNTAANQVDAASTAPDFANASRLLGIALKLAQGADAAAAKCAFGGSVGIGSGDYMKATISGDFDLQFSATERGTVFAIYDPTANALGINAAVLSLGGVDIGFWVSNVDGPGTYPLLMESAVSRINPSIGYVLSSGTITFTTYDLANQKAAGTFSFTASADTGDTTDPATVTVEGAFRISKITTY